VAPQPDTARIVQDVSYSTATALHSPSTLSSIAMLPQETQLFSLSFDLPLREARDAFERAYFEHHLTREGGSMTRVAEKTGLERTHLYRKLKQLGVEPGKLSKKGG
jgi:DNA-binding NtrC family response regulator